MCRQHTASVKAAHRRLVIFLFSVPSIHFRGQGHCLHTALETVLLYPVVSVISLCTTPHGCETKGPWKLPVEQGYLFLYLFSFLKIGS